MLPMNVIIGLALQLGFAVSAAAVLAVWGGHAIDERFGTEPYGFWVGVIVGLAASLGLVWQIVRPIRARATMDDQPTKKKRTK